VDFFRWRIINQDIINEEYNYFNDFENMIEDEVTAEDAMKSDKSNCALRAILYSFLSLLDALIYPRPYPIQSSFCPLMVVAVGEIFRAAAT